MSVDEKIVLLKFNNTQFERGVKESLGTIENLKKGLNLDGIAEGVEKVSSKFSVFGAIGFTAIQKLTDSAIGFGQKIAGAVLDPLVEGGKKRALNIEQAKFQFQGLGMDVEQSMADALYAVKDTAFGLDEAAVAASQFGASGIQSGEEMQSALRGISGVAAMAGSSYSDIANVFTKVAGQGRLMGDDLNRLGTRGINAAATLAEYFQKTGQHANATEADIRSMVTKGQIDFKTFAAAMADAFGDHATKANETYTGSLANMRAAISRIGASFATAKFEKNRRIFNALTPVIDSVGVALEPVVELFEKFSMASAESWEKRLSGLDFSKLAGTIKPITDVVWSLKQAFDAIVAPITKAFSAIFKSGNSSDKTWLDRLNDVLAKIASWTESLKLTTTQSEKLQKAFETFFGVLKGGGSIVGTIVGIFFDLLRMLGDMAGSFLKLLTPAKDFFKELLGGFGGSGKTSIVGKVNNLSDKLKDLRSKGLEPLVERATKAVEAFASMIQPRVSAFMSGLTDHVRNLGEFFAKVSDKVKDFFSNLNSSAPSALTLADRMSNFWGGVLDILGHIWDFIGPIAKTVGQVLSDLATGISNVLSSLTIDQVLGLLNTGILGALVYNLTKAFSGDSIFSSFKGIFSGVTEALGEVTGVLKAMQNELKAKTLLNIALAIGVLAAAVLALSLIDPGNLGSATAAVAALTAALVTSLVLLSKFVTPKDLATLPVVATSMIILGGAVLVLSSALKKMAGLDWEELAKGLIGVGAAIGILVAAARLMSGVDTGLLKTAGALLVLSVGVVALAGAVKIFSTLSWEEVAKGISTFAATLALTVGAMFILDKAQGSLTKGAGALLVVSAAMLVFSGAILALGNIPFDVLQQGLIVIGILLGGMVVAFAGMSKLAPKMTISAGAIIAISIAMNILSAAILALGLMPLEVLAKGVGAVALTLGALSIATKGMTKAVPGAAATLLVASAILVLSGALKVLAGIPVNDLLKGIGAIAGVLAVLGVAALILAPLQPVLLTLGGAVALLGAGMVLISGAMFIFAAALVAFGPAAAIAAAGIFTLGAAASEALPSVLPLLGLGAALIVFGAGAALAGVGTVALGLGLSAMAVALALIAAVGTAGAYTLVQVVEALAGLFKQVGKILAVGAAFVVLGAGLLVLGSALLVTAAALLTFGAAAALAGGVDNLILLFTSLIALVPVLMTNVAQGIVNFARVIRDNASTIIGAFTELGRNILNALKTLIPDLVDIGVSIIESLLSGVRTVIPDLLLTFKELVLALLETIREVVPSLIETGKTIVISLLTGLREVFPELIETIVLLVSEIITGLRELIPQIVDVGVLAIKELLSAIRDLAPEVVETARVIIMALVDGLVQLIPDLVSAGLQMLAGILQGIADNIADVAQAASNVITEFISAISAMAGDILDAGLKALSDFLSGIADNIPMVVESATEVLLAWLGSFTDNVNKIITAGTDMLVSFLKGVSDNITKVAKAATDVVTKFIQSVGESATRIISAGAGVITNVIKGIGDGASRIATAATNTVVAFIRQLGQNAAKVIKAGTDLIISLIRGIGNSAARIARAAVDTALAFIKALSDNSVRLANAGMKMVVDLINGLSDAVNRYAPQLRTAGGNLASSVINGITGGLSSKVGSVFTSAWNLGSNIVNGIKSRLNVNSPSRATMMYGVAAAEGLAVGMENTSKEVSDSAGELAESALDKLKQVLDELPDLFDEDYDLTPTVTPVLDLSEVDKGFRDISKLSGSRELVPSVSFAHAADISRTQMATDNDSKVAPESEGFGSVTFIQNNTSPKALSSIEIYRQTRNQLSSLKGL